MPTIKFIEYDGTEHLVRAEVGQSVMQVATNHQVPGILGDCGGSCSCATCHGYVDESCIDRVPPPGVDERDMIACALDVHDNSRLTCQIRMTPELDGIVIHLPQSQT